MTAKKDLKRRVRERMAQSGESYTQALAHVREGTGSGSGSDAQQEPARRSLIERAPPSRDLTRLAAREGFTTCSVSVSERAWEAVAAEEGSPDAWFTSVFEALRRYLVVNIGDRAADLFRSVVVRGAPAIGKETPFPFQFHRELAEGRRGVSPDARLVALDVPGKNGNVLVVLWTLPARKEGPPQLFVLVRPNLTFALPETWPVAFHHVNRR